MTLKPRRKFSTDWSKEPPRSSPRKSSSSRISSKMRARIYSSPKFHSTSDRWNEAENEHSATKEYAPRSNRSKLRLKKLHQNQAACLRCCSRMPNADLSKRSRLKVQTKLKQELLLVAIRANLHKIASPKSQSILDQTLSFRIDS